MVMQDFLLSSLTAGTGMINFGSGLLMMTHPIFLFFKEGKRNRKYQEKQDNPQMISGVLYELQIHICGRLAIHKSAQKGVLNALISYPSGTC